MKSTYNALTHLLLGAAVTEQLHNRLKGVLNKRTGAALALWGEAGIGKTYTIQKVLRELPCQALSPAIDLRSDNNPVITWQEKEGSSFDIYVKRWTGSSWVLVGNEVDRNIARHARRPSIVLKSNNNPIIS